MTNHEPSQTPNVVVSDPRVRKVANIVLGAAGLVLGSLVVFDGASADLDFSSVLAPAFAVYSFLAGAFGLIVTTPNVPKV